MLAEMIRRPPPMPISLPRPPSLPVSPLPHDLQEAGDVYWLNSLDGGQACLLVNSYRDLADGIAVGEAFRLIEGYSATSSCNIYPADRLRKALATVEKRRGKFAVPPRLLQPAFSLRVCRGEAAACGELVSFLKRLHELNNDVNKTEEIIRNTGGTNVSSTKHSRNKSVRKDDENGTRCSDDESRTSRNKSIETCFSTKTRARISTRAHPGHPFDPAARKNVSQYRREQPTQHLAKNPNGTSITTRAEATSVDRTSPQPPLPPPRFSPWTYAAPGLRKRRSGEHHSMSGANEDGDRGIIATTTPPSRDATASAAGAPPLPPFAATVVSSSVNRKMRGNGAGAAAPRPRVKLSVFFDAQRDAAALATSSAAHATVSKLEKRGGKPTVDGAWVSKAEQCSQSTERSQECPCPRRRDEDMGGVASQATAGRAGTTEAGRRRADQRYILRWMDRLGVKVDGSLLTPEGTRCHQRFSSGEILCELAAAIDYAQSGGRGLPLSEIPSCPGRFVLRGTCGAPANVARSRHNVRAALSAFLALGGIRGMWLRGEAAILEGDHKATWGLVGAVYGRYGHLHPCRMLRPRRQQKQEQRQYQQVQQRTLWSPDRSPHRMAVDPFRDARSETKCLEGPFTAGKAQPPRPTAHVTRVGHFAESRRFENDSVDRPASLVPIGGFGSPASDGVGRIEPQPTPCSARTGPVANTHVAVATVGTNTPGRAAERKISALQPTTTVSTTGLLLNERWHCTVSPARGARAKTALHEVGTVPTAVVAARYISPRTGVTRAVEDRSSSALVRKGTRSAGTRFATAGAVPAAGRSSSPLLENEEGHKTPYSKGKGKKNTRVFAGTDSDRFDAVSSGLANSPSRSQQLDTARPKIVNHVQQDAGGRGLVCSGIADTSTKDPEHPRGEALVSYSDRRAPTSDRTQDHAGMGTTPSQAGDAAVFETARWLQWDPIAGDSLVVGTAANMWEGRQTASDDGADSGMFGSGSCGICARRTIGNDPPRQYIDVSTASAPWRAFANGIRSEQPMTTSDASHTLCRRSCSSRTGSCKFSKEAAEKLADDATVGNIVPAPSGERPTSMKSVVDISLAGSASFGGSYSSAAHSGADAVKTPGGCVALGRRSAAIKHSNAVTDAAQTSGPLFDDLLFSTSRAWLQEDENGARRYDSGGFRQSLRLRRDPLSHTVDLCCPVKDNGGKVSELLSEVGIAGSPAMSGREMSSLPFQLSFDNPGFSASSMLSAYVVVCSDPFERSLSSDLLPVANEETTMPPSVTY